MWQGWFARQIAAKMNPKSTLWLIDPLTGHREPGEFDLKQFHPAGRYRDTSPVHIFSGMPNADKIVMVPFYIPEAFKHIPDTGFRFVRIDMDHYQPTKDAIRFFRDMIVPGGYMEFDDWVCPETPGAAKAIAEEFGESVPYWQNA